MENVKIICKNCLKEFFVKFKLRKQKYCSRECVNVSLSGAGNPAYGKTYRSKKTNPEWAEKISKTSIEREINRGEKNGMKNPEVAARQGRTRSQKFASDPSWKEKASLAARENWKNGKYDFSPVGKCKWYEHKKQTGELVKLQGTWEVVFAKYLESQGIDYLAHKGYFKYFDENLLERTYFPDFYLPIFNVYVDVKGSYFNDLNGKKFESIKQSNPELILILITKKEFLELGINITKEAAKVKSNNELSILMK
jgi:hypothetical protein